MTNKRRENKILHDTLHTTNKNSKMPKFLMNFVTIGTSSKIVRINKLYNPSFQSQDSF